MGLFKKIKKTVQKAGKQLSQNVSNLGSVAKQIGEVGALPVTAAFSSIGAGLTAAAPVIGQGTQILQDNPLLGQAVGSLVPGLGSLFSGPSDAGGGMAATPFAGPAEEPPGLPKWVWLAIAGAAALVLVLFLRRKD